MRIQGFVVENGEWVGRDRRSEQIRVDSSGEISGGGI